MTPEYDAWSDALAHRFLQERASEPLYLYTDDSVLEEVAPEVGKHPSQAVDSFTSEVVRTLRRHREPFREWALQARAQIATDAAPRFFGVLCFLVLVAVESDTTHFQYYPGLNKRLERREEGAPPGFDHHVPLLFNLFNDWLTGPGAKHGVSTAAAHPHFPNVGWPLSQAIVRPADRALIVRLFSSCRIPHEGERTGSWLRARVVPALKTGNDSPSRRRLLQLDSDHPEILDDALAREFRAWDGGSSLRVGPRRLHLRLCYDETYGEWWLLAPRVEGTAGKSWRVGSASGTVGAYKGIEAGPAELWELVGTGDVGRIDDGPLLASPVQRRRWMSVDAMAGGWAEVAARDPQVDSLLLVRAGDAPQGLEGDTFLHEGAPSGWSLFRIPAGRNLFDGGDGGSDQPTKPVLDGGLVLDAASRTYLLSPSGLPCVVGVRTSAKVSGTALTVVDGRADLNERVREEGTFNLRADGVSLPLRAYRRLKEGPEPSASADANWWAEFGDNGRVRVPGEHVTVWLVGAGGEAEERPVRPSEWLHELDLMDNEVDVTGLVRSIWFPPVYVIGPSYMGKPWVEQVPEHLASSDESAARKPARPEAARELVSRLLIDYGPDERKRDARWKRTFAALLRSVHQR